MKPSVSEEELTKESQPFLPKEGCRDDEVEGEGDEESLFVLTKEKYEELFHKVDELQRQLFNGNESQKNLKESVNKTFNRLEQENKNNFDELNKKLQTTTKQEFSIEEPSTENVCSSVQKEEEENPLAPDKEEKAEADIHMVAVKVLVESSKESESCWSNESFLFILLQIIVFFAQSMISTILLERVLLPSCTSNSDCPSNLYCKFDYDDYTNERVQNVALCEYDCHQTYSYLLTNGYQKSGETFQKCSIGTKKDQDKCLNEYHCYQSVVAQEIGNSDYDSCHYIKLNRDLLDVIGVIFLALVACLFGINIYTDIASGKKQLGYLQQKANPGILKQICASVIIARCTLLPILVTQVAVALNISGSLQPSAIVLSALSVTFVLQIDNIVGKFAILLCNWNEESIKKCCFQSNDRVLPQTISKFVISMTCVVVFLYQILTANKIIKMEFGNRILPFLKSPASGCGRFVWALVYNGCALILLMLCWESLIAMCETINPAEKYWNLKRLLRKIFTLLSACVLYLSFGLMPWGIQVYKYKDTGYDVTDYKTMYGTILAIALILFSVYLFSVTVLGLIGTNVKSEQDVDNESACFSPSCLLKVSKNLILLPFALALIIYGCLKLKEINFQMKLVEDCPGYKDGFCRLSNNNANCKWDGGDCYDFNEKYPQCKGLETAQCKVTFKSYFKSYFFAKHYPDCIPTDISAIGDGICHDEHNTEACGWDFGDCFPPNCSVDYPYWIGDGVCDYGEYNTKECVWDGGDCVL